MHFALLLAFFWLWRSWYLSRDDDKPLLPWRRGKKKKREPSQAAKLPPTLTYDMRRMTDPPPLRERIDHCWQDEAEYLDAQRRRLRNPEDVGELLMLLHTPGRMYRAAVFRSDRKYWVEYGYLRLHDPDELFWYGDSCAFGWWEDDPGAHCYADAETAEEQARAVLRQLESADQAQLDEPERPADIPAPPDAPAPESPDGAWDT